MFVSVQHKPLPAIPPFSFPSLWFPMPACLSACFSAQSFVKGSQGREEGKASPSQPGSSLVPRQSDGLPNLRPHPTRSIPVPAPSTPAGPQPGAGTRAGTAASLVPLQQGVNRLAHACTHTHAHTQMPGTPFPTIPKPPLPSPAPYLRSQAARQEGAHGPGAGGGREGAPQDPTAPSQPPAQLSCHQVTQTPKPAPGVRSSVKQT